MSCDCHSFTDSSLNLLNQYQSEVQPTWCGGCGNFAIWAALKRALVELELEPHKVLLVFDIGCNGNMNDKIGGYRVHTLHGRSLPFAAAAKIANPDTKVLAFAGDGATYSEGMGHFINTIRNDYPITLFVHDNANYALTVGQASATTPQKAKRSANPEGPVADTLDPIKLALSLNPSFIARAYSGNIKEMIDIMKQAVNFQEQGFSYVNILQSCPTFNKETNQGWYNERIKNINEYQNYSITDINNAVSISNIYNEVIYTGVLYKNPKVETLLDKISRVAAIKQEDIMKYRTHLSPDKEKIEKLLLRYK